MNGRRSATARRRSSLTARVLLGLAVGLGVGIAVSAANEPALLAIPSFVRPIGVLWVNAIRMTVLPLVLSLLVLGIANAPAAGRLGRAGGRSLLIFLALLFGTAFFCVLVVPPILRLLPLDPAAAAALRVQAGTVGSEASVRAAELPGFAHWFTGLLPANVFSAAAEGALLPLIIATILFSLALTRIPEPNRQALLQVVQAVSETVLTLVRWVLAAAPLGVFALAVGVAAQLGLAAAGAVLFYVVLVASCALAVIAFLFVSVGLISPVPLRTFARSSAPALAVAFSSRSSMAALPAAIQAVAGMGLQPRVAEFFLPLAATLLRVGSAIGIPVGVLFLARLYGVELTGFQLTTIALLTVITTFSTPGIPGASILVMMPLLVAVGLPPEGIGLLLGIDTIPDMFRTTASVAGHLTAATFYARYEEPAVAAPSDETQPVELAAGFSSTLP